MRGGGQGGQESDSWYLDLEITPVISAFSLIFHNFEIGFFVLWKSIESQELVMGNSLIFFLQWEKNFNNTRIIIP